MNVTTATRVLGLAGPRPAPDDLVSAWRRFARAHHPDRCPGDPEAAGRFATGREAFETLRDRPAGATAPVPAGRGRAGILRGPPARRALPYEMPPLGAREWRA